MLSKLLAVSALVIGVSSHFTLTYPTTWLFDDEVENQFCGGGNFTSGTTAVTTVPIGKDTIQLDARHETWVVGAFITSGSSPTSFADFGISSEGSNASTPNLLPYTKGTGIQAICIDVDYSKYPDIARENATATILVQFEGGDGPLYQCGAIRFSGSAQGNLSCATAGSGVTTVVAQVASATPTGSSSNSAGSGAPSSTSSTPSSAMQGSAVSAIVMAMAVVIGFAVSL